MNQSFNCKVAHEPFKIKIQQQLVLVGFMPN